MFDLNIHQNDQPICNFFVYLLYARKSRIVWYLSKFCRNIVYSCLQQIKPSSCNVNGDKRIRLFYRDGYTTNSIIAGSSILHHFVNLRILTLMLDAIYYNVFVVYHLNGTICVAKYSLIIIIKTMLSALQLYNIVYPPYFTRDD